MVGEWWPEAAAVLLSTGPWFGTLALDHEKDFQHLIYALQLSLFSISVTLYTEER